MDLKLQYDFLEASINRRLKAVCEHGQFIMGPEVRELESSLAVLTGAEYCITVASGTEALLISLMALGVGPGAEVITTPFTFIATAEAIVRVGAVPIYVDVEHDTGNINASLIEAKITERTRAIIPVSLYGQPADMDEINRIAQRHDLVVIEDAAQSLGARYKDRNSCNLSTLACTSFFPSKPLGCYGDGGAIFTSSSDLALACQEIRIHGQSERYVHTRVGVGGRMDTMQCAVVLAKLERFDWEIQARAAIAARYDDHFKDRVRTVSRRPDRTSVYAQYTVLVSDREYVVKRLGQAGIATAVHYPVPIHLQPAYRKYSPEIMHLAVAEKLSAEVLSLPMHAYLSAAQQRVVSEVLIESTAAVASNRFS